MGSMIANLEARAAADSTPSIKPFVGAGKQRGREFEGNSRFKSMGGERDAERQLREASSTGERYTVTYTDVNGRFACGGGVSRLSAVDPIDCVPLGAPGYFFRHQIVNRDTVLVDAEQPSRMTLIRLQGFAEEHCGVIADDWQ